MFFPKTNPDALTVAMAEFWLDQVPPAVTSVKEVVDPTQRVDEPRIGATVNAGETRNEITDELLQIPLLTEYKMLAFPVETAVTKPLALMDAIDGDVLDQIPPAVTSES